MAKIQVALSPEEDKIVEVYKLMHDLKSKQDAIKRMIKYFKVEIQPAVIDKKEYFK